MGPVTVTSNPEKVLEAVGNLQATAGGDCKEKGMTGLYQALLRSTRGSFIYYFSDAGVKDSYLENDVLALAKEKQISITFFITGKCQSRKRRSSQVCLEYFIIVINCNKVIGTSIIYCLLHNATLMNKI